jgi:hypothetical protein
MDDSKSETKENHGKWVVHRYIFCVMCEKKKSLVEWIMKVFELTDPSVSFHR